MNPFVLVYTVPSDADRRLRRTGCVEVDRMLTICSESPASGAADMPNPYVIETLVVSSGRAVNKASCTVTADAVATKAVPPGLTRRSCCHCRGGGPGSVTIASSNHTSYPDRSLTPASRTLYRCSRTAIPMQLNGRRLDFAANVQNEGWDREIEDDGVAY